MRKFHVSLQEKKLKSKKARKEDPQKKEKEESNPKVEGLVNRRYEERGEGRMGRVLRWKKMS